MPIDRYRNGIFLYKYDSEDDLVEYLRNRFMKDRKQDEKKFIIDEHGECIPFGEFVNR